MMRAAQAAKTLSYVCNISATHVDKTGLQPGSACSQKVLHRQPAAHAQHSTAAFTPFRAHLSGSASNP